MKILVYGGGLGNQIFGYAFTQYLRNKYPNKRIYGVYNHRMLNEHYGLEIDRWFDVVLPPSKWYVSLITYLLYLLKRISGWQKYLDTSQYVIKKENALVYFAQHADRRYIPQGNWLNFKLTDELLGKKNISVLEEIKNSNSVFIHVRRGDYLSPKYVDRFQGCCSLEYYNNAIAYIEKMVDNPRFFIFSNDLKWAKDNIKVDNSTYIDWNDGRQSPLDMYLMTQCKAGIMANSTFSYWGCMLGVEKVIVTYPEHWVNPPYKVGDIFPVEWLKM